jgi:pyruvate/2-oxoglutarate dehydrogenase complex dihydrolipoamide acyltransferase (E2) component
VLESDKASMDVPSPFAGTVQAVELKVGDKVSQGDLILLLSAGGRTPPPSRNCRIRSAPLRWGRARLNRNMRPPRRR